MAKGRELEVHNSICEREDFKILIRAVAKRNGKLGRGGKARNKVFILSEGVVSKHCNRRRVLD